jgi:hypothetical protein
VFGVTVGWVDGMGESIDLIPLGESGIWNDLGFMMHDHAPGAVRLDTLKK